MTVSRCGGHPAAGPRGRLVVGSAAVAGSRPQSEQRRFRLGLCHCYPMAEAIRLLREQSWNPEGGKVDLDPEGERVISALVAERHGHPFVFVTDFPP